MGKYCALWEYIGQSNAPQLKLTFAEVQEIAGVEIDHSFLNCKKELEAYGYQVGRISLKERTVQFQKISP
ncbi:hypothetical protein SDC9_157288 [bioreactor metagenome]|uniref:Uncharacterized protein n=1 Tax=bioreactor metagenome TaxID=1076179 RepID=A0A645F6K0_9ZZZZ|nr:hypothetical protein [Christensenella sp.]